MTLKDLAGAAAKTFFSISLALTLSVFSLMSVTDYDTMRGIVSKVAEAQTHEITDFSQEERAEIISTLKQACEGKDRIDAPEGLGGGDVTINCSDVETASAENFNEFALATIGDNVYNREYDCGFVDCLMDGNVAVIASAKGNAFYSGIIFYLVAATAALGAVVVLLTRDNSDRMRSIGMPMVFIGAGFLAISMLAERLVPIVLPGEISPLLTEIAGSVLSPLFNVYIYMLIVGVALTVTGYLLRRNGK